MVQVRYDNDANPNLIQAKRVAIIGYGSQGHAHALNLRDSGVQVQVGLHDRSTSRAKAENEGLVVDSVRNVTEWADMVMLLAPDTKQPAIYEASIRPALRAGMTLMFGHGFNVRYQTIEIPQDVDVSMVAPKSPGHRVRETYQENGGVPGLLAVHQDASGRADQEALSYAYALGCTRAGVLTTTFTEETETDLFGEQAVLCGGVSELVKAGFETLVDAGYQPEIAYFECLHELKLIVDLMYRGGLSYMRYSVSDTAEFGDYDAGRKVIGTAARDAMKAVLTDIQDGSFARRWIEEDRAGRPSFATKRKQETELQLEAVGAELREMMTFVRPVSIKPGE